MARAKKDIGLDILRALRRVASQVSDQSRALSDDTGLTIPQLLCLKAIADARNRGQEATVAYVSDSVSLAPSTVSGVLDRLERAALVRRRRNSVDRRQVNLILTRVGRSRLSEVPDLRGRVVDSLQAMDDTEREATLTALRAVVAMLEGHDPDLPVS
ncbi:MAG: winged helix-turn-helix transcriptional regulator [Deltaproteobacteria bacterium]|nr:winged helix-turn-helix transcriptional regulator [Deltaproteobacteria bacterium]MBW2253569.1 winged helix-turn-helix transcriptional regulator [Deltaproteobacteria bacterium]